MKKIRFTALCLTLALSVGLLAGCGKPEENSLDDKIATNSPADSVLEDDNAALTDALGTTVESSTESSIDGSDESEESPEESSLPTDESEPEETSLPSESADSAASCPDDEREPESPAPSKPSEETSKNGETGKQNPGNTGSSHKHSYRETANVAPTCMENGYILFTCSCGDSFKEDKIGLKDHDFLSNPDVYIEPTETARGKLVGKCAYGCGASISEEYYSLGEVAEMLRPRVLYWINYYRKEAGVPEVTISEVVNPYSQYRATQLVTNYAHDKDDQRAAADATHFGTHYESAKACPDTGWHPASHGEIISSGQAPRAKFSTTEDDIAETIDRYAKRIIDVFYNSPRHRFIMLNDDNWGPQVVGIGIYKGYVCINFARKSAEEVYDYWYEDAEGNLYHAWVSYETGLYGGIVNPTDDSYTWLPASDKYNELFFIISAEDWDWF